MIDDPMPRQASTRLKSDPQDLPRTPTAKSTGARDDPVDRLDQVEESSQASFPCSDPPSFTTSRA